MKSPKRRHRSAGTRFALAFLACAMLGALYSARPHKASPLAYSDIVEVQDQPLKQGKVAPEITWRDSVSGKRVRLSDFRGKPVILFFGSCTCGPFRLSLGMIEQLRLKHLDRFHTFIVYATEAHPEYGRSDYTRNPHTLDDRHHAVEELIRNSDLKFPVLVDTLDNRAEKCYGGAPTRAFVLDSYGRVVFVSPTLPSSNMAVPVPAIMEMLLKQEEGAAPAQ